MKARFYEYLRLLQVIFYEFLRYFSLPLKNHENDLIISNLDCKLMTFLGAVLPPNSTQTRHIYSAFINV
jgi:hypothetical protein